MLVLVDSQGQDYGWHVGTPKVQGIDVVLVQADGHELEYVLEKVKNLPTVERAVVRWTGDLARFIYDNAL